MARGGQQAGVGIVAVEDDGGRLVHRQKLVELALQPAIPGGVIDPGMHLRGQVLEGVAELLEDRHSLAEGDEYRFQLALEPTRNCDQPRQMADADTVRRDQEQTVTRCLPLGDMPADWAQQPQQTTVELRFRTAEFRMWAAALWSPARLLLLKPLQPLGQILPANVDRAIAKGCTLPRGHQDRDKPRQ